RATAARRGGGIRRGGDAGNRAAQAARRPRGTIAAAAAAVPVAREAQPRACRWHRAVLAPAALCGADRRTEDDLAVGQIEHVVTIGGAALGERLDELPALPDGSAARAHLEPLAVGRRENRPVAQPEHLTGSALALADGLVPHGCRL